MSIMQVYEEHLKMHEIRPTAVRLVVWKAINEKHEAFSLSDVENWLPDLERTSIFRSLKLMAEKHLLHVLDDGTGICKYCVCRCGDGHHLNHVHFTCVKCGRTLCITDQKIPVVTLPEGFESHDIEYIIKGLCQDCSRKRQ